MAARTDRGVPLSTLSPKYLHTNSTSHTWPFSAIAELIDNAYDPDVNAKQFWIDKTEVKGEQCLSFMDNGNGLDQETMHKMLSFGYSDKVPVKGVKPIGMYGNGFKSGSMRLGKDAIVFSKSKTASCVGMLSQTYLEQTKATQISVPIVCFEQRETNNVREEHKTSLQDILRYSPFTTQEDLLREIDAITSTMSTGKTGTRIIIWNLRRTSTRPTEFDFESDRYDIRIPADVYEAIGGASKQADRVRSNIPDSFFSLRAYCSILYLKPRTQIIIRGQKVKTQLIAKSLAHVRKDHYNPKPLNKRVPITFGYNTKSKDQYGVMMYHKNRLIKAYERVGCQLKANNKGVGVIGVIECDFLEPTHNKQSFNETDMYRKTMTNLGTKLEKYWTEIRHSKNQEDPNSNTPVEDTVKRPDQNWAQCDDCLKWRKLPDGIDPKKLSSVQWYCSSHPDPRFRSCQVDEELEDSDHEQPSYFKTYKQQQSADLPLTGKMAALTDRGILLSTLCPKYLHTNSTSHTWPFSAIAELIDNAYDPDVNAKQFWIDKTEVKGEECLSFMDNGYGLDQETMHKMLSFGYSDKVPVKFVKPIGMYGNGFKSGSMRLGKDAIVFSKSKTASCIGMLSQTYLEQIKANQISVPIVCFEQRKTNKFSVREDHKTSLHDILRFSPFTTQEDLLREIDVITSTGKTGTRIIIWNLRRTSTRPTEFDFESDRYDIRIPADVYEAIGGASKQADRVRSNIPDSFVSLRAYCSILYRTPRTQIIIRGQKVKTQLIAKSMAHVRKDHYTPKPLKKRIPITFGYNTKSKHQYGVMMYHKNRLIKAYERVGCQLKANKKGVGVIGVIECDFLEPTHNKQSFNETDMYRKTMTNLGIKLEDYWTEIRHSKNQEDPNSITPVEDTVKQPDQNWAQCDDCLKWRKLPDGINPKKLPEKWYCSINPDPQFRSCEVDEEFEDSDDEQPSYRKTYKQQERENKRNQERERQIEENRKRQEEQCLARLSQQKQAQKQPQVTVDRLHTPAIVCSPSTGQSTPLSGRKRAQSAAPQETPKRPKANDLHRGTLGTSASVHVSPASTRSLIIDQHDDNDDILILETASTPKPKGLDLSKVKTEKEQSDANVGMLLECSDDAAVGDASDTNAAGTGSAAVGTGPSTPAPLPVVSSITTQIRAPKVKEEGEERAGQSGREQGSDHVDVSVGSSQQRVIKHESSGGARCKSEGTLQNRVTPLLNNDKEAGPSAVNTGNSTLQYSRLQHFNLIEVQEQFLELMQALTCELRSVQSELQELSAINVKKEYSHQASKTDEAEEEKDYKSLFKKGKQKVDELIKDKEILLAATKAKPSTAQFEEKDINEMAVHVDLLMRKLDQRDQEKEDLRLQLERLEEERAEERANLTSECEELRLSLLQQQKRETAEEGGTTPHRAARCKSEGTLQNRVTPLLNNDKEAGPSAVNTGDSTLQYSILQHFNLIEVQEQLLQLIQASAQERGSLKEQVEKLTCELRSMQSKQQELSAINVKKESSHQAFKTDEAEEEKDYKNLFKKAKQEVDKMIKDKEILLAATKAKCEEKYIDEMAVQVDLLMRKLDQRDQEKEDLRLQLERLEEERANLTSKCEELRLSLLQQQKRETAEEGGTTPHRAAESTAQTVPEDEGATANSGTDLSSDTTRSLIALRRNIGRLLISYVPLELDQVDYECNVIDEILEQVLSNEDSVAPVGQ